MTEPGTVLDSDLDHALARFQQTGLEWAEGLANHGPMAVEALQQLGHPALIEGFVDSYVPRMPPLVAGDPLDVEARVGALGDPLRLPDWIATYDRELAARPWRELLATEVTRLLPGLFAGSVHGMLRVAHAVRAIEVRDTPVRRRELALGLAYWAGRYQELPGTPGAKPQPGQSIARTFEAVTLVPPERRRFGLFSEAVRVLDDDFARCIEAFDPASTPAASQAIHEICRESAQRYLLHPTARIAYVHCVTAPSALRLFAHHLDDATRTRAVGYALQAALGLHAVSAGAAAGTSPDREVERLATDPAEIRYRAACSLEEHAIKMAEACLREQAVLPDPVFPRAAADAAIHLDSGGGRGAR